MFKVVAPPEARDEIRAAVRQTHELLEDGASLPFGEWALGRRGVLWDSLGTAADDARHAPPGATCHARYASYARTCVPKAQAKKVRVAMPAWLPVAGVVVLVALPFL